MADYDLEVVTPPATDEELNIVTLDEIKLHLRMFASSVTTFDDVLKDCVRDAVAILHGEHGELNRTVMPMTWKRHWPCFPTSMSGDAARTLWLPFPPITSVTSVEYRDTDGVTQTLASSEYEVVANNMHGRIVLLAGNEWPDTEEHPRAVTVTYVAGYSTYPKPLKRLVKLMAGHYYENIEATLNEPRVVVVNRLVQLGHDHLLRLLRIPSSYGNDR